MPVPNTLIYLYDAVHDSAGGYTLNGGGNGLGQTLVTFPWSRWVSGISDLNGDHIPDVVTGAPGDDDKATNAGRIFIDFGRATGGVSTPLESGGNGIIIDGLNRGDLAGTAVGGIEDLNGDGRAEILIGAPMMDRGAETDAGAAFVIWGRTGGGVDLGDPFTGGGFGFAMKGELAGDHAGTAITAIGDLNGDGKPDLLVGAPGNDAGGSNAGAAYVVWGKSSGSVVNLSSVAAGTGGFRIVGEAAGDEAGVAVAQLHDLNGDGRTEMLIGADGNGDGGAVYVVYGKSGGAQIDLSAVAAGTGGFKISGTPGDAIGTQIGDIGDINGDGLADILIGSSSGDAAYVVFGKTTGSPVSLADVASGSGGFKITAEAPGDLLDISVTGGADLNRDGVADFIIGTPHDGDNGTNSGAIYVVWGGRTSTVDLSAIATGAGGAEIIGTYGSLTGSTVAITGDMNGDGTPDLLIASPGNSTVSVVYTPDSWQPDHNVYGTNGNDVMGDGYGDMNPIGAGEDSIFGLDGNDTIDAGMGNDSIDGGLGADRMTGGSGDDTYYVDDTGDRTIEASGGGTDTVVASVNWALNSNVENLVLDGWGLSGTGNSLANRITGSGGNDTIDGHAGADTMTGGAGNDTYYVENSLDTVVEDAGGGTDTVVSSRDWTLGDNVENLILAGTAHKATGNALNNGLTGGDGNDTLDGKGGNDTMSGGLGDDTYMADNSSDVVVEVTGAGIDTVIATADYLLGANIENLVLSGAARHGVGNADDNSLTGTTGNDELDGAGGNDTMAGGVGDDTYHVDAAGDVAIENAGEGTDTVISARDGYVLGANLENLTLVGSATHGTGNGLDNIIIGTAVGDVLDGKGGSDTLNGGLGNDTYVVNSAGDAVHEDAAGGSDTVRTSADYTLSDNVENLVLTGSAHSGIGNALDNNLTGGAGNDSLSGLDGNDTIDGGVGADTMAGGAGNDTYFVDNPGDVIVEAADGGTDTVVVSSDWSLSAGSNVENVRVSEGGHSLTGNTGDNTLSGSSGDDHLDGGDGDDTELGGDGSDRLVSTSGHDQLSGGSGDDVYEVHGGSVHIEDFLGHDELDASEATGDSYIDLSSETESEIEGEGCDLGQGGTTVGPLDVQFLQDLTGSFSDDIANVRALVPSIVAALDAVQPDSEFGLSSFIDKAVAPFGAPGEWVYQLEQRLTADPAALSAIYNAVTTHNGEDLPECQVEALMHLALTASEVGFRPDAARFVIVFTDAPYHLAGDGVQGGITTPNNGDAVLDGAVPGTGEDYPAIAQLAAALQAANIIPIFAVTADVTTYYTDLVAQLGRGTTVTLTSDSSNVVAAITGGLTDATRTTIEDADGGAGDDTLIGNDVDNRLVGNGGDDTLTGGLGNDILVGGSGSDKMSGDLGNDTYYVDSSGDRVNEASGGGTDRVYSSVSFSAGSQSIENITLTGTDNINVTGNGFANTLVGNSGNNVIDGGAGGDSMSGGAGNDTYYVGSTGDTVHEASGRGTDWVYSSVSFSAGSQSIENITLTGTDNINVTGNGSANTLVGNSGNNVIDGGAGGDSMSGGAGNDTYYVGSSGDRVHEASGSGIDWVYSSVSFSAGSQSIENITLTGTDNINVTGNGLANTLVGNSGNNVIDGGTGGDTMIGGAGNDTYYVSSSGDKVKEVSGGGTDWVYSSVSFSAGMQSIENITLTGNANVNVTGSRFANHLTGNSGDNIIDGGQGGDTLAGGLGADTFVFALSSGHDTIADFKVSENDHIDVSLYHAHDTAVVTQVGSDVTIDLGGGNVVTVLNATTADVTAQVVW